MSGDPATVVIQGVGLVRLRLATGKSAYVNPGCVVAVVDDGTRTMVVTTTGNAWALEVDGSAVGVANKLLAVNGPARDE